MTFTKEYIDIVQGHLDEQSHKEDELKAGKKGKGRS